MAQKKQKQVKVKRGAKPSDFAKLYKQESMRQYKSSMSDLEKALSKVHKYAPSEFKEAKKLTPSALKAYRKAGKIRLVKKAASKVPGVGAAIIAHDVMRAGAKKGCIKRGGKWVSGKCQIAKKPRTKASGPDPRFSRTRGKKK